MSMVSRVLGDRRRISLVGAGVGLCLMAAPAGVLVGANSPVALASSGGNSNKGDVWLDNVGQPAGPGHEMDPHLACTNINLWGDKLADPSGTYVIDGWPPSGSQEQDYLQSSLATWVYDQITGGKQVIDVIDVQQLIKNAVANGDAVHNKQGFHFKLQFSQDPQKHKTFWVNCPAPTPPTTSTPPTRALSKTVSPSGSVPVNKLLTYTITLKNLSAVAASNITVDDTMSGSAAFTVNDGTNGTTNSFAGNPTVTVTKHGTGHYSWTYATVAANATDMVTYTAVIKSPGAASTAVNGTFTLANTAVDPQGNCATPNVPACTTANSITPVVGGVEALSTATPGTGSINGLALAVSGFLVLGGLGLALVGLLIKRPEPSPRVRG